MKHIHALLAVASLAILASCASTSITPYEHGYAVGGASYLGYSHLAVRQDDDFRSRVASLWSMVDAIDSADTLVSDLADVASELVDLAGSDSLTPADKAAIRSIAQLAVRRMDAVIAEGAESHPDEVEFLRGFRDGVDALRALE